MQYRRYDNRPFLMNDFINDSIRKASRITPTNVFARMTTAVKQRIYCEFVEHGEKFFDKSIAQAFAPAVVPSGDLDNVVFCFRS